jgi:hypothetical protein
MIQEDICRDLLEVDRSFDKVTKILEQRFAGRA